ncbi:DUF4828 domain-containing protein [Marinilactibacillus kalidii]|uniref:DUF4828 domain-containing protein n=1 Tax=Marinilactibacillus kalidii TaxID=2820274 RepID=UPI001ABE4191|nr:DUF4828 domain-containing protein [Marinilactibacillus kalidii]
MKQLSLLQRIISWIKPNHTQPETMEELIHESELVGSWSVDMPKSFQDVSLEISAKGTGKYHTQPLKTVLPQETPDRLVLRDHFGYQLVVEKKDNEQYVLFDELDNATYPIEKNN